MKELDNTDRQILNLLQRDDRQSLSVLGKQVGLAASSVNDRVRRLVERGAVEGFHARINPEAVGLELLAFIFVGWSNPAAEAPFLKRVSAAAAVQECHHVTGEWNYLLKVRLANTRGLEQFLNDTIKSVSDVQRTETLIVLSSAKETAELPLATAPTEREKRRRRSHRAARG